MSVSMSMHSAGGESDIEKYAQDNLNVQVPVLFMNNFFFVTDAMAE